MRQLYWILFLFSSLQAIGQSISFVADCNASEVVVGNAFRVSFRLQNADIKNINFPDFEDAGFRVLQGPISESNYSYINGARSSSEAYIFILMTKKEGNLQLSPAKVITSKGQTLRSKAIQIKSIATNANTSNTAKNANPSIDGEVIFRVVPSTKRAITGEQITLDFKIYTKRDLTSIEIIQEPSLSNVYAHDLRFYNQEARIEVLNGVQYATKIIQSKAIFPSKEGELIIEPAEVAITLGRFNSANAFSKPRNYTVKSDPVKIDVRTLDKVPMSFTGGVGDYEIKVHVESNTISTDDALQLTFRIIGRGDIKQVLAPPIYFGKTGTTDKPFDIYPPSVKEEVREGNGFLGGIKEFQYKLNPEALGEFQIRPTFSYYDTKKKRMITLDTLIDVKVTQGQRKLIKKDSIFEEDTEEEVAKLEFKGLQTKAYWRHAATATFGTLFFWIICILPFLVFAGLWLGKVAVKNWLVILAKRRNKDKPERDAEAGILLGRQHLETGDAKALFETISTTLKSYLSIRLNSSAIDMDKEVIKSRLTALDFDKDLIRQLDRIFKVCEETIFAGQDYKNSMQRTFEEANEILPKLFQLFK